MCKRNNIVLNYLYKCIYHPSYSQITNNIYIGNYGSGKKMIQDSKEFTHIISFIKIPDKLKQYYRFNGITYYEYTFDDDGNEDIIHHFRFLEPLIQNILFEQKGTLLIHCTAGKSRSVSITTLTLMTFYNFSLKDAINLIKSKRNISINSGFQNQLRYFQYS